jgi:hypothetical protein
MNSRQFFGIFFVFLFCNLFQEQGSSDFTRVTLTRKHLHTKEEKKKILVRTKTKLDKSKIDIFYVSNLINYKRKLLLQSLSLYLFKKLYNRNKLILQYVFIKLNLKEPNSVRALINFGVEKVFKFYV